MIYLNTYLISLDVVVLIIDIDNELQVKSFGWMDWISVQNLFILPSMMSLVFIIKCPIA